MNNSHAQLCMRAVFKQFQQGESQLCVLSNVSVVFEQGKTYAITGISGTGKSTVLHLLAGLDTPTSGVVCYNDRNLALFNAHQRAAFLNKDIGLVFQSPYLIHALTVLENVMLKGMIASKPSSACREKARHLLAKVGLSDKANAHPASLSGGQQQRVAIARALLSEPAFLLADEPTGNLDEQTAHSVIELMLACQAEWRMGIIVSSHDRYVAHRMSSVFRVHEGALQQEK